MIFAVRTDLAKQQRTAEILLAENKWPVCELQFHRLQQQANELKSVQAESS